MRVSSAFLGGLITLFIAHEALAAPCINGHPSLTDEYNSSKYVIKALVVDFRELPETVESKNTGIDIDAIKFKAIKVYKGNSSLRSVRLLSPNDSARIPVSKGDIYLAFIIQQHNGGELFVDTCGNSDQWSNVSDAEIKQLNRLRSNREK